MIGKGPVTVPSFLSPTHSPHGGRCTNPRRRPRKSQVLPGSPHSPGHGMRYFSGHVFSSTAVSSSLVACGCLYSPRSPPLHTPYCPFQYGVSIARLSVRGALRDTALPVWDCGQRLVLLQGTPFRIPHQIHWPIVFVPTGFVIYHILSFFTSHYFPGSDFRFSIS